MRWLSLEVLEMSRGSARVRLWCPTLKTWWRLGPSDAVVVLTLQMELAGTMMMLLLCRMVVVLVMILGVGLLRSYLMT